MSTLNITAKQRDTVNIDGVNYELKLAEEFSFEYCMKISEVGEEIKKTDYSKKGSYKKVMRYMNRLLNDILIAPRKVKEKLNDQNKMDVINFFLDQKAKRDQAASGKSSSG